MAKGYLQIKDNSADNYTQFVMDKNGMVGIGAEPSASYRLLLGGSLRVNGDLHFTGSMTSGTVPWANISGAPATATRWPAWSEVTGKPSTFTPSSHSHGAGDLPSASTSAKGVVQLSSAVNSTSTTLAATASAVKSAYDLANSKWAYNEATIKAVKVNSAGTADTLATARTINGTSFNGSANITTANWGTARTLTIGSAGKSVNGSANVSWTLAEIGAAPASHTHTSSQVGLGNVQNYGIATQAQAEAGTANSVYMTPLRVKEAISSLTPVTSVAGKTGAVTLSKSDVGLGSVQNYGIATKAQAEAGTANSVYMTPLRVKEAIASQASSLLDFYKLLDDLISRGEVGIAGVAGIKNSMYRGKNLGTSVTPEQYANISNGTFKDMYIGDYWVINGTTYIIAAFNYYYNTGDTNLTTNHVTLVPAGSMYAHRMNPTNTTDDGYVGSEMRTTGLNQAKTKIHADFAGRVLTHRRWLSNETTSGGDASSAVWLGSDVELMNEVMVYGSIVFGSSTVGGSGYNIGVDKVQLPLFALRPDLISIRTQWWLRDIISGKQRFAAVTQNGIPLVNTASTALGVRPVFSIA
jgi:hypothetical protein